MEFQLIQAAKKLGLCSNTEMKALHGMINKRNECAHPNGDLLSRYEHHAGLHLGTANACCNLTDQDAIAFAAVAGLRGSTIFAGCPTLRDLCKGQHRKNLDSRSNQLPPILLGNFSANPFIAPSTSLSGVVGIFPKSRADGVKTSTIATRLRSGPSGSCNASALPSLKGGRPHIISVQSNQYLH